jgi:hypothetical protein
MSTISRSSSSGTQEGYTSIQLSLSEKIAPSFSEESSKKGMKILKEAFALLDCTHDKIKKVLEQIKALDKAPVIKRIQQVFSVLTVTIKPTNESEKVDVEKIRKKINKRLKFEEKIEPIEIIAAMLLKGYSAVFYGGVNKNLDYWCFEAELIVKVSPMMLGKLEENQDDFDEQFSNYPKWMIEKINKNLPQEMEYKHYTSKAKLIGSSYAHIFYTEKKCTSKVLKGMTSKTYEPLIFLLDKDQKDLNPIIILASKVAWEDIRPLCSERFSKHVSTYLASYCIKTEQVYTKQAIGSSSSSDIQQRAPLALDIDQRGSTCHAFTGVFPCFEGIEGGKVRIKFFEEGLYINSKLSLEDYEKFARFFMDCYHSTQPTHEWGMPQLPNHLTRIADEEKVCELNQAAAAYLAGDTAKMGDCEVDLELADEIRLRANKFILTVPDHRHNDSFVQLSFESQELSLQEIANVIHTYRGGNTILHPPERWIFHLNKGKITLHYRLDEVEYKKSLLDCLEGKMEMPDRTVYFRSLGRWYQYNDSYYSELRSLVPQLEQNFLKADEEGFLGIEWNRKYLVEEAYSRLYLQHESEKKWYDGNKKRIFEVEICDIMLSTTESTYLYHLKKSGLIHSDPNIGTSLRVIASQLIMSAQIIRGEINKGINEDSELYRYCNVIKGARESPLEAFRKKNIIFVLALPFPSGDPLNSLLNSRSTIARGEIIQLKKKIENDMGFTFKIAPIPVLS